jgi:hypothetical protein
MVERRAGNGTPTSTRRRKLDRPLPYAHQWKHEAPIPNERDEGDVTLQIDL